MILHHVMNFDSNLMRDTFVFMMINFTYIQTTFQILRMEIVNRVDDVAVLILTLAAIMLIIS